MENRVKEDPGCGKGSRDPSHQGLLESLAYVFWILQISKVDSQIGKGTSSAQVGDETQLRRDTPGYVEARNTSAPCQPKRRLIKMETGWGPSICHTARYVACLESSHMLSNSLPGAGYLQVSLPKLAHRPGSGPGLATAPRQNFRRQKISTSQPQSAPVDDTHPITHTHPARNPAVPIPEGYKTCKDTNTQCPPRLPRWPSRP